MNGGIVTGAAFGAAHLSGWPRLLYGLTAGGERGVQHAVDTSRR